MKRVLPYAALMALLAGCLAVGPSVNDARKSLAQTAKALNGNLVNRR